MHAAPPVRYPIKPSRLRQACEGGVFILAVLCLGFWAYQTEPSLLKSWPGMVRPGCCMGPRVMERSGLGLAHWMCCWTSSFSCCSNGGLRASRAGNGSGWSVGASLLDGTRCAVRYIRALHTSRRKSPSGLELAAVFVFMTQPPTILSPAPDDSDLLLVQRAVEGNQRAFELLVLKYQRRVARLVARMVRDSDLVDDVVQETFIRAYRALHQFRGEAQFYTWLYRIAVNTAKKALVDLRRNPVMNESALRGRDDDDETSPVSNELSSDETPETVLAAKEIGEAVNSAMEALPEDLRQAVTLREIEGLSYDEIAEVMNCPIGTVRSRIFRAREAISAKVKPLLTNQTGKRW